MAKIFGNKKSGQLATARELSGVKTLLDQLGFVCIIENYQSYFYGIWIKYNNNTKEYEFEKTSKTGTRFEEMLIEHGYMNIKEAYSNVIKVGYHFEGGTSSE